MADDRSRRRFLMEATGLTALLASIERAAAIEADPGSTYRDAKHVVILMQENRSFDHMFGCLRGVRGFNDPRAVTLPDGKPVWQQSNAAGETYEPFRLNIRDTNITWLGSLPHSWRDQTDARNHGNHDRWLDAKPSGRKECAGMPLTLGYYNRADLPFYYALADAFTICDQHFCSSLTGTTPNRHYLWTGTVRPAQTPESRAYVRNGETTYNSMVRWTTYPERLEDAGVSWKIYQNELSIPSGLTGDEDAWLANFTDNPIEWFEQHRVKFSKSFRDYAAKAVKTLPAEIAALDPSKTRERQSKQQLLRLVETAAAYTDEEYAKLSQRDRNLHEKAFCTNSSDPEYRDLTTLTYRDGDTERTMTVPKGDVLRNFREDVQRGQLPTVSWIVPPERFSDHPGAPWYGAWMVSEVLRILTENPEIWKKTIFVLTYDENDGYFDHIPPFVAPTDASLDQWSLERDRENYPATEARGGPIGLGYRVPLILASPWSRGGAVCSQVFDHTSVIQLLETLVKVREPNISPWRRTVCGDLSSAFQAAGSADTPNPAFMQRDAELQRIYNARFKPLPSGFRDATPVRQEPGVRRSLPLPYELYAGGSVTGKAIEIFMESGKGVGAPFHVYKPGSSGTRAYAVVPGGRVSDQWDLDGFAGGQYRLCICGPNGFLRELAGSADDPKIALRTEYQRSGDLVLVVRNEAQRPYTVQILNHMYRGRNGRATVEPGREQRIALKLGASHCWYDFTVKVDAFVRRFAGRVETGKLGYSDPVMGGLR